MMYYINKLGKINSLIFLVLFFHQIRYKHNIADIQGASFIFLSPHYYTLSNIYHESITLYVAVLLGHGAYLTHAVIQE